MPSVATNPSVDWDLAFLLFSKGQTYDEISLATGASNGAIRKRASRHDWRDKVSVARHNLSQAVQKRVETLAERGEIWQKREATNVERVTDVLDNLPIPKAIKPLREYVDLRACHGKHGRSTFGLDRDTAQVNVNIGLFNKGKISEIANETGPVVDVDPAPSEASDSPTQS